MVHQVIVGLLLLCLAGIGYIIYFQKVHIPEVIEICNRQAFALERLRHPIESDLSVTLLDINDYMKNFTVCVGVNI